MLGLQLGYAYAEGALLRGADDGREGAPSVRTFVPSSRPGARLPHGWLDDGRRRSALDPIRLDCLTFRLFRERWPGLQAPQHTVLYSKDHLLKFVAEAGLEVVDYLPYGAFPAYFYLFAGLAFKLLKEVQGLKQPGSSSSPSEPRASETRSTPLAATTPTSTAATPAFELDAQWLKSLNWRSIGPAN